MKWVYIIMGFVIFMMIWDILERNEHIYMGHVGVTRSAVQP